MDQRTTSQARRTIRTGYSHHDARSVAFKTLAPVLRPVEQLVHELLAFETLNLRQECKPQSTRICPASSTHRPVGIRSLLHEGTVKNLAPATPKVVVGGHESAHLWHGEKDRLKTLVARGESTYVVAKDLLAHDEARTGGVLGRGRGR